jgi:hypothetical protein
LAEGEPRSWRQWSEFRKVANIAAANIEIYSQLTSSSVVDSWSTGAETADCKAAGIWLHTETTPAPARKEAK